jgi:hypothetical protein
MTRKLLGFTLSALLAGAVMTQAGFAQTRSEKRADNQQKRIDAGKADGSLNDKEAARLQKQNDALDKKIERDKVDGGGYTKREKAKNEVRQDRQSRRIAKQRHDKQ